MFKHVGFISCVRDLGEPTLSLLLASHPLGEQDLPPCVQSAETVVRPMAGEPSFEPFMIRHYVGAVLKGYFVICDLGDRKYLTDLPGYDLSCSGCGLL